MRRLEARDVVRSCNDGARGDRPDRRRRREQRDDRIVIEEGNDASIGGGDLRIDRTQYLAAASYQLASG